MATLLLAVAIGAFAQIVLKRGLTLASTAHSLLDIVKIMATQPLVAGGMVMYLFSSVLYLRVLQAWPVGKVYPMVAVSYVLAALLGWILLKEQIVWDQAVGLAVICLGVLILARSGSASGHNLPEGSAGASQSARR